MSQCRATSKRSGERCKKDSVVGRRTCHMHGGTSRVGILSPVAIHGDRSRILPPRLVERYRQAQADSELLAMRNDIATVEARLEDVLSRVDSGESGQLWRDLGRAHTELQRAQRAKDQGALRSALVEMGDLIDRGASDREAWRDVLSLMRDKKALVESERRRLVEMQQMITSTEAMTLVSALSESVKTHVHDEAALTAISADLMRLIGRPADASAVDAGQVDR